MFPEQWDRFIVVDTHNDMIQFAHIPDECVVSMTDSASDLEDTGLPYPYDKDRWGRKIKI